MSEENAIPTDAELRTIPDGEVLHVLPGGLMIVRRKKHEYTPKLADLAQDELANWSNKRNGSKFNSEWSLAAYVRWVVAQLEILGWNENTAAGDHTVEVGRFVGWSSGIMTTRVRIEISSRCIHAYPVLE